MDQVLVPYVDGYDYGIGVRSATASPVAPGVEGTPEPVRGASGSTVSFSLHRVQTTDDLERYLGVSADVSGGIGLFGAGVRFGFAQGCGVQASSLVLILTSTVHKAFRQIRDPTLTKDAAELASKGHFEAFAEVYGDMFVRGVTTGGEFFGVYRIDTKSEASRQKIEMALQGAYGPAKADAGLQISQTCNAENASIYVYAEWKGGNVTQQNPTTPEELLTAIRQWQDTVQDQPVPYQVSLAPYVIARGGPREGWNREDLMQQREILTECARLRSRTIDNLNLVNYILDSAHTSEFLFETSVPDLPALNNLREGLSEDLEIVNKAANWAIQQPKEALSPELFARKRDGKPHYRRTVLPPNMPRHETIAAASIEGVWQHTTAGVGSSELTFKLTDANRFHVEEKDLGHAKGSAVLNGASLRFDFVADRNVAGWYTWTLNREANHGQGNLQFNPGGGQGEYGTTLIKLR